MNSMLKNTLMAAGLMAVVLTGVRAADSTPPAATGDRSAAPKLQSCPCGRHGGGRDRLQHLAWALDLTPQQQEQIAALYQAVAPQKQAIMNEPLSQADRRARLHALMTDTQAKVRAVLTPDQQKKFDAMPHPRRGGCRPKPGAAGERPDGPPPAEGHEAPAGAP
jgi:Spy/CpxP family protein refolding chaperone